MWQMTSGRAEFTDESYTRVLLELYRETYRDSFSSTLSPLLHELYVEKIEKLLRIDANANEELNFSIGLAEYSLKKVEYSYDVYVVATLNFKATSRDEAADKASAYLNGLEKASGIKVPFTEIHRIEEVMT